MSIEQMTLPASSTQKGHITRGKLYSSLTKRSYTQPSAPPSPKRFLKPDHQCGYFSDTPMQGSTGGFTFGSDISPASSGGHGRHIFIGMRLPRQPKFIRVNDQHDFCSAQWRTQDCLKVYDILPKASFEVELGHGNSREWEDASSWHRASVFRRCISNLRSVETPQYMPGMAG